jgi:PAS domain S-box-containing protein
MFSDDQQENACLYVLGTLSVEEASAFEKDLSENPALRKLTRDLADSAACFARVTAATKSRPSTGLRDRIVAISEANAGSQTLDKIFGLKEEAVVVTDSEGLVAWANEAFTKMCGYSVEELLGKRPGRLLRGPETDPEMVRHLGTTFLTGEFCTGTIVNYHKNGRPYWVSIAVNAVFDDNQKPIGYIAVERELKDQIVTGV